jgi:hypothetical protein
VTEEATLPRRSRATRAFIAAAVAVALLLAAVLVLWFGLRLVLAQWLLDDLLETHAPPGTTAHVAELSPNHAVLTDIKVPELGRIARAEVIFTLSGLLEGRVEDVILDRPDLEITLDADGSPTGPLRDWAGASPDAGETAGLPLARLTVDDAVLHIAGPFGWANLALEGRYDFAGRDSGEVSFEGITRLGDLEGEGEFSGFAGTGPRRARIVFSSQRLGIPGAEADVIKGRADLTLGEDLGALLSLEATRTALDGHALGPLMLSGTWHGGTASFDIDIGDGDSAATLRLSAGYEGQDDKPSWSLTGLAAVTQDIELPLPSPLRLTAPSRVEFDLAGTVPATAEAFDVVGGGILSLSSAGVAGQALVTGPLELALDLAVENDTLTMNLDAPASVTGIAAGSSPPAWLAALPPRTYDLAVPPDGLRIALRRAGEGYGLIADFDMALTADDGFASMASGHLDLGTNNEGTPVDGGLRRFDVALHGPLVEGVEADEIRFSGEALLSTGGLQASIDAVGDLTRLEAGGISARGVHFNLPVRLTQESNIRVLASIDPVAVIGADRLVYGEITASNLLAELPLEIALDGDMLTVTLTAPGWVDLGAFAHPNLRSTASTSLKLEGDTLPILTLNDPGKVTGWDARVVLGETAIGAELLDAAGVVFATLSGGLPDMRVSAGGLSEGRIQATAESHGGELSIAGPDVAVAGMALLLSYNNGLSPWPQIQATGIHLRDLVEPARFVPATLDLAFKPVWPGGKDARMSLDIHMAGIRYVANIEGSWEPARDRLSAYIRIPPIRFSPDLQPTALSPLYGPLLTGATGAVEIVGSLGMEPGAPFADLDINLDDLSGMLAGAEVEALAGSIHLSGIAPLRTPPDQQLTAGRLDPGLPMENLSLTFSLPGNGAMWLSQASLDFAGGTVEAQPTTLDPEREQNRIVLDVADVELVRLGDLLDLPELEASGSLSGEIPVLLQDNDLAIEGGRLATKEPGVLRYIPEGGAAIGGGDENVEMLVTAVSNFHYQSIVIDLDRALGGASIVGLHISGANPELYDGYPIELNVNLTGDLDRIVRDSLAGWRVPEEIRKRLSGF